LNPQRLADISFCPLEDERCRKTRDDILSFQNNNRLRFTFLKVPKTLMEVVFPTGSRRKYMTE
jgi:hypothetical protein